MTRPVYVRDDLNAARKGDVLELIGDEGRHATTVRRTRVDEEIDLVNGSGLRVTVKVTGVDKARLVGQVLSVVQEDKAFPQITLVQALAKGGRDEQAVETATEFGVDTVIPWSSERAIVSWRGKEDKGRARWRAMVRAAAKQSRRAWIPDVTDIVGTTKLATLISMWTDDGDMVLLAHEEADSRLSEYTEGWREAPQHVVIIIGPEGGISGEEAEILVAAGAKPVLLSKHVLRSATAGAYALAVIRSKEDSWPTV